MLFWGWISVYFGFVESLFAVGIVCLSVWLSVYLNLKFV